MRTRADKLLEGFKLGDLGAGRKKVIPRDTAGGAHKTVQMKLTVKILTHGSGMSMVDGLESKWMLWEDYDQMKYAFFVHEEERSKGSLYFYAGKNLQFVEDTQLFKKARFTAIYKKPLSRDDAFGIFDQFVNHVEKFGMRRLLTRVISYFTGASGNDTLELIAWRENKEKEWDVEELRNDLTS